MVNTINSILLLLQHDVYFKMFLKKSIIICVLYAKVYRAVSKGACPFVISTEYLLDEINTKKHNITIYIKAAFHRENSLQKEKC